MHVLADSVRMRRDECGIGAVRIARNCYLPSRGADDLMARCSAVVESGAADSVVVVPTAARIGSCLCVSRLMALRYGAFRRGCCSATPAGFNGSMFSGRIMGIRCRGRWKCEAAGGGEASLSFLISRPAEAFTSAWPRIDV